MLLIVRHNAKSSIAQEERLVASPNPPGEDPLANALYALKADVIILIQEKNGSFESVGPFIYDESVDVARSAPQGGSLPCRCYLLVPLTGIKEGSKGLEVLRERINANSVSG